MFKSPDEGARKLWHEPVDTSDGLARLSRENLSGPCLCWPAALYFPTKLARCQEGVVARDVDDSPKSSENPDFCSDLLHSLHCRLLKQTSPWEDRLQLQIPTVVSMNNMQP